MKGEAHSQSACLITFCLCAAKGEVPATTKIIVSSHDYEQTAREKELMELVEVRLCTTFGLRIPPIG